MERDILMDETSPKRCGRPSWVCCETSRRCHDRANYLCDTSSEGWCPHQDLSGISHRLQRPTARGVREGFPTDKKEGIQTRVHHHHSTMEFDLTADGKCTSLDSGRDDLGRELQAQAVQ